MTTESTGQPLAEEQNPGPGRGHGPLALAVISGAVALDIGSLNIVNPALPGIGAYFSLTPAQLQWIMTAYAIAFGGFLLLGGRLADVYGRGVFAVGIAVFTVAALVSGLASDLVVLIIARAVQGIGAALTEYLGWRWTFFIAVVFGVLVLAGIKSALPAGVRHPRWTCGLPRVSRTGILRLIHAASWPFRYSSRTSCGGSPGPPSRSSRCRSSGPRRCGPALSRPSCR